MEKKKRSKWKTIGLALLVMWVAGTVLEAVIRYSSKVEEFSNLKDGVSSQAKPPEKAEAPKEPECARDDLDCRGNKVLWTAGVFCRNAIEEQARFNFRWTNGFAEPKFDRYEWTNKPGKGITVIGDKVEFQNALGNYLPVTYWCDLPENGENYVAVRVKAGKFR